MKTHPKSFETYRSYRIFDDFLIHFGWGKPVQINPMYYKKPHLGELMVALAGPATNLF
jgi:Zn-dependent protease